MCNTKSHKRFQKKNHQNLLEKKLAELFNLVGSFSINPKEEKKWQKPVKFCTVNCFDTGVLDGP